MKTERLPAAVRSSLIANDLDALQRYRPALRRGGVYGSKRKTILHLACKYSTSRRLVRYLVETVGVNPHSKVYKRNVTCLHYACGRGALGVVRYLVGSCGADVNLKGPYGMTPLYVAVKFDRLEVAKFLVGRTEEVQVCGKHQWTCAHWAAFRGNVSMLQLFPRRLWLQKTADGNDLATLAARNGHIHMLEYLRSCGYRISPKSVLSAIGSHWSVVHWLLATPDLRVSLSWLLAAKVPAALLSLHSPLPHIPLQLALLHDRADLLPMLLSSNPSVTYTDLHAEYSLGPDCYYLVLRECRWERRRLWLWTHCMSLIAGVGGEEQSWARLPGSLVREIAEFI